MSDLLNNALTFVVVGFVIALGLWLLVKAKPGTDAANSGMRGSMQSSDWFNAAINLVAGVFFGLVVASLSEELTTNFWLVALLGPVLFAGFLLFDGLISGLIDKVFPSGIRPARNKAAKGRTPLPRLFSLPLGIVLGVVLGWFGLGDSLLAML